jgi:hypothetical protein
MGGWECTVRPCQKRKVSSWVPPFENAVRITILICHLRLCKKDLLDWLLKRERIVVGLSPINIEHPFRAAALKIRASSGNL